MIKGKCVAYLDDYRGRKWPEIFAAVPRKGEFVQAEGTLHSLMVIEIKHTVTHVPSSLGGYVKEPFIIVSLGKQS